MAIVKLKIRRPIGRLIFNMGIAIPGKTVFLIEKAPEFRICTTTLNINNNGPNGHLFYVGGDLMMMRGMLSIIMLPDGDLRIALHLVPFFFIILTIWGSVHIEETVVGWRNQLRMKTSAT